LWRRHSCLRSFRQGTASFLASATRPTPRRVAGRRRYRTSLR
jgi:hypothetical protein